MKLHSQMETEWKKIELYQRHDLSYFYCRWNQNIFYNKLIYFPCFRLVISLDWSRRLPSIHNFMFWIFIASKFDFISTKKKNRKLIINFEMRRHYMEAAILLGLINSWTVGMIRFGYKITNRKNKKNSLIWLTICYRFFFQKRDSICDIPET